MRSRLPSAVGALTRQPAAAAVRSRTLNLTLVHSSSFSSSTRSHHAHPLSKNPLLRDRAYVNGKWVTAAAGPAAAFDVADPATGDVLATVPNCDAADTRAAIQHASDAFAKWKKTTARERSVVLRRWHDLVMANKTHLAQIVTGESGKPIGEAEGEIAYSAGYMLWFSEEGPRAYGDIIPTPAQNKRLLVMKQPVGVCGIITPWNFPLAMLARKVAPALAAGCTTVVKPPDLTPLTALAFAALGEEAGVPAGVYNVVTTKKAVEVGAELTSNPVVRKISFTGSTNVGKQLMKQSSQTMQRMSLELGGNAPFIVFDDADLDAAVEGLINSKFRNTGQTCVCANRVFVQKGIYDAFAARLADRVRALKVGHGYDPDVRQGPLIDGKALEKVKRHVDDAVGSGAAVSVGGKPHALGRSFFEPTVLVNCTPSMLLAREETFGPVAGLIPFETESAVVAMANDTPFGLAGYFFSRDLGRIFRVAEALEVGMVGVNEGLISTEVAPFGGVKESGMGREGSKYGLQEYMETKYLCLGGI